MGDEAWYQSISDYEEENYFNSPHLQHSRHGNNVAAKKKRLNPSAMIVDAGDHDTSMSDLDTMPNGSNQQHLSAWSLIPAFAPTSHEEGGDAQDIVKKEGRPEEEEVEEEIFADIDIGRDLDALVKAPLDFGGVEGPQRGYQEIVQPAMMMMMMVHNGNDGQEMARSSPITSVASHEEDMSSSSYYSPGLLSHHAINSHDLADPLTTPTTTTYSPSRHNRHCFPVKRLRKSLPNSPMRSAGHRHHHHHHHHGNHSPYPSVGRSASFGPSSPAKTDRPEAEPSSSPNTLYSVDERTAKDEFLVKSRREGMTYRDIKQQGGFTEAESTLRGRYRMLTKNREERVRSPKWTPVDVVLLRKAVLRHCSGRDPVAVKIPWKEIARFIFDNGGTYLFGNATCRKKWDELASFGIDQEIDDDDFDREAEVDDDDNDDEEEEERDEGDDDTR